MPGRPSIWVVQSCRPRSRTEDCSATASMITTTPLSVIGLPLSWRERNVWFTKTPAARPSAPGKPMRLEEMSRNCRKLFSLSALPIAVAPPSMTPFHARLSRSSFEVTRPCPMRIQPVERSVSARPWPIAFHEKSACFRELDASIRLPSARPPSSPMPLSETSSFAIRGESFSRSSSAFAPMSPMLLPRRDTSLIRWFFSSASATCAQPRPSKLL